MRAWIYVSFLSLSSGLLLAGFWARDPVHPEELPLFIACAALAYLLFSFEIVFVYGGGVYADDLSLLLTLSLLALLGPTFALSARFLGELAYIATRRERDWGIRAKMASLCYGVVPLGLPFLFFLKGFSFWSFNLPEIWLFLAGIALCNNVMAIFLMVAYDVLRYEKSFADTLLAWFSLDIIYFNLFSLLFFPALASIIAYAAHRFPLGVLLFVPLIWLMRESAKSYQSADGEFQNMIECFQEALEARDAYTEAHCGRVSEYARVIARFYGLPFEDVERIGKEARLHDIGKLFLNDEVLVKPGSLTKEEYEHIKNHTRLDKEILSRIPRRTSLARWLDVARLHHERWDGKGYPWGLKEEAIPLDARIMAVADAWDAMTSNRVYRQALSKETALKNMRDYAGKQWDPKAVEAFFKAYESGAIQAVQEKFHDHP